jgi:hypothetical protein
LVTYAIWKLLPVKCHVPIDKICDIHSEDIRTYIFTILEIYSNRPKRRFDTDNHRFLLCTEYIYTSWLSLTGVTTAGSKRGSKQLSGSDILVFSLLCIQETSIISSTDTRFIQLAVVCYHRKPVWTWNCPGQPLCHSKCMLLRCAWADYTVRSPYIN